MLPGGGARGAYQVGAVRAIHELAGGQENPFPIIVGTSAGAINAAVLASHAHEFGHGLDRLEHFWREMRCESIYRTDWPGVLKSGLHWLAAMAFGRLGFPSPASLLDTSPLRRLLERETRLEGIGKAIEADALRAAAVTASGYTSAKAISFYQAAKTEDWVRPRRIGRRQDLTVAHLMASAALPLLFPASLVGKEYFGDGGLRQTAPLSPAIHLGAERILIISTRDERPDPEPAEVPRHPSIGDIGGYMLDVVFMDNLQADLDRLQRINRTLQLIEGDRREEAELRHIETLIIRPSCDVRDITARHKAAIPGSVKALLAGVGAWREDDSRLPSYLLFDRGYCRELIELGHADAMAQEAEIRAFLNC